MIPTRFLTDASLELVARRLRMLGYDVRTLRGARLEELYAAARDEQRTVLTPSARHPRRFADVPVVRLPRDAAAAIRQVADHHEAAGSPFSRCTLCNGVLQRRQPLEATGEVPGRVLRNARFLAYCPLCGKWFWDGSHVAHVRSWLSEVLGREVPGPG